MSGLGFAFISATLLIVFPYSLVQMGFALEREDLEFFCVWTCLASFVAGLPFMLTMLSYAL